MTRRVEARIGRAAVACALLALGAGALSAPERPAAAIPPERPALPLERIAQLAPREAPAFVPGEVVVRFEPGAGKLPAAAVDEVDARRSRALELPRTRVLELPRGTRVREAVSELEDLPGVAWAEPNYVFEAAATLPSDEHFARQWALNNVGQEYLPGEAGTPDADIDAPEAWDHATGEGAVVAVVDTGVQLEHPDIQPNLWENPGEIPGDGIDNDGNGLPDDVHGWDFVTDDGLPQDPTHDPHGHGTHVAGTVAAAKNEVGVVGVAWDARIMALRVLDPFGRTTAARVAEAFAYAGEQGADVVNASLAGPGRSLLVESIVKAYPETLFVAAAGNGGDDAVGDDNDAAPQFPCNIPADNLICVAATDPGDQLTDFSNFGASSVDVAAPGQDVLNDFSRQVLLGETFTRDVFTESPLWTTGAASGSPPSTWGRLQIEPGVFVLADSPAGDYAPGSHTYVDAPLVPLAGKDKCALSFDVGIQMINDPPRAPGDEFTEGDLAYVALDPVGAAILTGEETASVYLPIGSYDGDVALSFGLWSDDDDEVDDGVWFDLVRIDCRANAVRFLDGTSMAAPHVAAVAAVLRSWLPDATVPELRAAILGGVDKLPGLAGKVATGGRLNAHGALRALDRAALTTEITKAPRKTVTTRKAKAKLTFKFRPRAQAGLECKLDKGKWKPCKRTASFKVGKGKHTLRVRANRGLGAGPVATHKFRVKRRKG